MASIPVVGSRENRIIVPDLLYRSSDLLRWQYRANAESHSTSSKVQTDPSAQRSGMLWPAHRWEPATAPLLLNLSCFYFVGQLDHDQAHFNHYGFTY